MKHESCAGRKSADVFLNIEKGRCRDVTSSFVMLSPDYFDHIRTVFSPWLSMRACFRFRLVRSRPSRLHAVQFGLAALQAPQPWRRGCTQPMQRPKSSTSSHRRAVAHWRRLPCSIAAALCVISPLRVLSAHCNSIASAHAPDDY